MVLFVKRVGVVGGGAMGSQIADIMAINGKEVIIKDISEEYLKKARENVENNLDSLLEFNVTRPDKEIERIEKTNQIQLTDEQKNKIKETLKPKFNEDMKKEAMDKIQMTTDYKEFNDVDLVIEAVLETVDLKRQVFAELDKNTPSHAILATNTSSLSVTEIASATNRPEPELCVTVASSLTLSVSLTPIGSSFTPVTVIVILAVSVPPFPSETVYVNTSVTVSLASNTSAAL